MRVEQAPLDKVTMDLDGSVNLVIQRANKKLHETKWLLIKTIKVAHINEWVETMHE